MPEQIIGITRHEAKEGFYISFYRQGYGYRTIHCCDRDTTRKKITELKEVLFASDTVFKYQCFDKSSETASLVKSLNCLEPSTLGKLCYETIAQNPCTYLNKHLPESVKNEINKTRAELIESGILKATGASKRDDIAR